MPPAAYRSQGTLGLLRSTMLQSNEARPTSVVVIPDRRRRCPARSYLLEHLPAGRDRRRSPGRCGARRCSARLSSDHSVVASRSTTSQMPWLIASRRWLPEARPFAWPRNCPGRPPCRRCRSCAPAREGTQTASSPEQVEPFDPQQRAVGVEEARVFPREAGHVRYDVRADQLVVTAELQRAA